MTWTRTPEDRKRHRTQKARILEHLRTGKTLTQDEARALFGCMRLASRVSELRRGGCIVLSLRGPGNTAVYLLLEAPTNGGDSRD